MEVAMPMSGTAMDCYEDMFKEITRKLYGEDGLPDLTGSTGGGGATISTNAATNNSERTSHGLTAIDYDVEGGSGPTLKPEEHLTAFGLAALMQNGFPGAAAAGILNTAPFHHHHHHHHHAASHHLHQQHTLHSANTNASANNQQHNNATSNTNALKQQSNPTSSTQQQQQQQHHFEDKWIISEDNIPWTQSKIATYNPAQKLFRCAECDCVGYLPRVAEHWLGTHSNLRVFQCPQCPYESAWARCVRMHLTRQHNINIEDATDALLKNNPVLQEVTRYLQRLKSRLETNCSKANTNEESYHGIQQQQQQQTQEQPEPQQTSQQQLTTNVSVANGRQSTNSATPATTEPNGKRYSCTYCPYATDRRDLFTRHENIHREEKPFQCYVCQKQFNRADHVKKHFLRMHREHPYDLNRIRRHPPKNASGMSYYQKYNNNGGTASGANSNNGASAGAATSSQQEQVPQVTAVPVSVPPSVPVPVPPVPVSEPYHNSAISIPNTYNTINRNNMTKLPPSEAPKPTKSNSNKSSKKKGEKRFSCCYCSWSGVDNWCLKRHMNTHLKPFICALCDYKAARSERLATHVLKVHNKRACGKCNYLAENSTQLMVHQQENHPNSRNNSHTSNNVLRNTTFTNSISSTSSLGQQASIKVEPNLVSNGIIASAASTASILHNNRLAQTWKPLNNATNSSINPSLSQQHHNSDQDQHHAHLASHHIHQNHHSHHHGPHHHHGPKQHGAARLFNYMEASDGSENECDSPRGAGTAAATEEIVRLSHRIESDFPEAGDVGTANSNLHHHHQQNNHPVQHHLMLAPQQQQQQIHEHYAPEEDDGVMEEPELPLFVCRQCGCEFEDDGSLETHSLVHRNTSTSPAKPLNSHLSHQHHDHFTSTECIKENINPSANYTCQYCDLTFASQASIIIHMQMHTTLKTYCDRQELLSKQRSRKQSQPRKLSALEASENRTKQRKLELYRQVTRRFHFRCYKCKTTSKEFSSLASYILHKHYFHGSHRQFQCEHCPQRFRHKYQMVIHCAKMHVPGQLPDTKITMAYFDHSSGTVNGHMPLVIPTFPPN